jgi:hypothetical protein
MRLAIPAHPVWPSAFLHGVGTPEYPQLAPRGFDFTAQYLACTFPCQRFTSALADDGA